MSTNEELQEQIDKLTAEFEAFKMFAQRESKENRRTLRSYTGATTENFLTLQAQMDTRFDTVNEKMDMILNMFRRNLRTSLLDAMFDEGTSKGDENQK